jgi:hypothetical protein
MIQIHEQMVEPLLPQRNPSQLGAFPSDPQPALLTLDIREAQPTDLRGAHPGLKKHPEQRAVACGSLFGQDLLPSRRLTDQQQAFPLLRFQQAWKGGLHGGEEKLSKRCPLQILSPD